MITLNDFVQNKNRYDELKFELVREQFLAETNRLKNISDRIYDIADEFTDVLVDNKVFDKNLKQYGVTVVLYQYLIHGVKAFNMTDENESVKFIKTFNTGEYLNGYSSDELRDVLKTNIKEIQNYIASKELDKIIVIDKESFYSLMFSDFILRYLRVWIYSKLGVVYNDTVLFSLYTRISGEIDDEVLDYTEIKFKFKNGSPLVIEYLLEGNSNRFVSDIYSFDDLLIDLVMTYYNSISYTYAVYDKEKFVEELNDPAIKTVADLEKYFTDNKGLAYLDDKHIYQIMVFLSRSKDINYNLYSDELYQRLMTFNNEVDPKYNLDFKNSTLVIFDRSEFVAFNDTFEIKE